jgi:hypothetical protein
VVPKFKKTIFVKAEAAGKASAIGFDDKSR